MSLRYLQWIGLMGLMLGVVVSGCADQRNEKGDFSSFFVQEMVRLGGTLQKTNGLPRLSGQWSVKRDALGFECHVVGPEFADIEALAAEAFGVSGERHLTDDGSPYRLFKASSVGVALIIRRDPNGKGVVLNCVKGL